MKKLLLPIFLFAQFGLHVPEAVWGQSAPTPATASQTTAAAATTPAAQADALKEADALSRQVVQLYQEGKFKEALQPAERALAIREGALDAKDRRIAVALANVGAVRIGLKDFDKAESLYRRALAIYEGAGEQDSASVMGVLDQLVYISTFKRDYEKAEASAQKLMAIAEKKYKPEQLEMARALVTLAELARLQLDSKRARSLYARTVAILETHPPASVPKGITASLANYLGLLYGEEGGKDSELTERINKLFIAIASGASSDGARVVEGGIINGRALFKPQPEYPPAAISVRAQGVVRVKVTVDESGKVISAKAFDNSPHPALSRAAEAAALRARFTPTLLSGMPVKVNGVITYNFVLGRGGRL
jgi:TonB family protein